MLPQNWGLGTLDILSELMILPSAKFASSICLEILTDKKLELLQLAFPSWSWETRNGGINGPSRWQVQLTTAHNLKR